MPLTIGIDIRSLMSPVRTGVGEYTAELLSAIFTMDRVNQYYLFYNSSQDVSRNIPLWNYPNVHIVSSRWPNKVFNTATALFAWPKIDRLIEKQAGITLDFFFSPNLNFTALSAKTRHILTIHDLFFIPFPHLLSWKQRLWHHIINPRKVCLAAEHLLVPSQNTKRDLVEWFGVQPKKITVIYPGLSRTFQDYLEKSEVVQKQQRAEIQIKYNLPEHYVLYVGSLDQRKNILAILHGFTEFKRSSNPDFHLVLAGPAGTASREIKTFLTNNADIIPYIHTLGYIANADKPSLYQNATALVYPSFYEGFGFPVLEAMNVGTPVITSERASLGEVGGDAVYYVNPHQPAQITEGLERIITSSELRERMRTQGLKQAQKFSWDKAAQQWLNMVEHL